MAMTATEAYEAMRTHHRVLGEQLAERAEVVSGAVAAGRPYEAAVGRFIAYLAGEVLPHAAAEEETIYPLAAAHAELAGMVGEMTAEHITLSAAGSRLAVLTDGSAAAGQARQIAELFAAHAAKENDVLLPALFADESANLTVLLGKLHGGTTRAHDHAGAHHQPGKHDGAHTHGATQENGGDPLTAANRIRVRRIYDAPSPDDGTRVLVDRVWPRGISKDAARLDEWAKDVAPSAELRVWYRHDPARFDEFRRRYAAELASPAKFGAVSRLRALAARGTVTLLTATKEVNLSQAAVLAELLVR
jgi:uncharacterized protein YeaO (DUF488 family)